MEPGNDKEETDYAVRSETAHSLSHVRKYRRSSSRHGAQQRTEAVRVLTGCHFATCN